MALNDGDASPALENQNNDGQQNANSASPEANGGSSAAKDNGANTENKSLLDVTKDALDKTRDPNGSSPDRQQNGESKTPQGKDTAKAADPVPDEKDDDKLPFHQHPRFKQVIAEKNQYKIEVERQRPEIEEYRTMRNYMQQHGVQPKEVAEGYKIMAALKTDPLQAMEMLRPYWTELEKLSGSVLSTDIQNQVDAGSISEEMARQMVRTRNEALIARNQGQMLTERQRAEQVHQQTQQLGLTMAGEVTRWEENVKKSDPDYAVKAPLIETLLDGLIAKNPPRSAKEAIDLSQKAYDQVSASFTKAMPQRVPIQKPVSSGQSFTKQQAVPASALDAAKNALAATRG